MMRYPKISLLAGVLIAGSIGAAYAQSASTVGSGSASEDQTSGTIGSGGSAAAGDTSASGLSTGGTSTAPEGTSSTVGAGGSAAAADGKTMSRTKINENPNNLQGQTKSMAHDGGTWSKVKSKTKVKEGESLDSRSKAMSHEPGGPPAKSTVRESVELGQ